MDEQKVMPENQKSVEQVEKVPEKPSIMKQFPSSKIKGKGSSLLILGSIFVVLFGVGTGWFLSGTGAASKGEKPKVEEKKTVDRGNGVIEIGEAGEEADEAEGTLKEGGVKGEGTHRLERDGGPSQTICLTSTMIDLQEFSEKKVKIWGETISPIECPWLMDVVKIKAIE